jgi:hypothetical protein
MVLTGGDLTPELFEASPGFLDLLVGNSLGPRHVSTAASPYWATAFLTIQQGMACAGTDNNSAATNKQPRIIYRA